MSKMLSSVKNATLTSWGSTNWALALNINKFSNNKARKTNKNSEWIVTITFKVHRQLVNRIPVRGLSNKNSPLKSKLLTKTISSQTSKTVPIIKPHFNQKMEMGINLPSLIPLLYLVPMNYPVNLLIYHNIFRHNLHLLMNTNTSIIFSKINSYCNLTTST